MKGTSDAFQFCYRTLTGDGTFTARITPPNGGAAARGGLMLRSSLSSNAANVFVAMDNFDRLLGSSRVTTGGATSADSFFNGGAFGGWVSVTRTGNTITTSSSVDGASWTPFQTVTLSGLPSIVYVGLASTSGANGALGTVTMDHVWFSRNR